MKKPNFGEFAIKHLCLFIILFLVLIVSVYGYICVYGCIDSSAASSLISGTFTYIGSVILGVFVYYHTWFMQRNKEWLDRLNIEICPNTKSLDDNDSLWKYSDISQSWHQKIYHTNNDTTNQTQYYYLKINILNRGFTKIDFISLKSICIDSNNMAKKQDYTYIFSSEEFFSCIIDYKESKSIYIGIDRNLINHKFRENDQTVSFVFEIIDSLEKEYMYIGTIRITAEMDSYDNTILLDKKDFYNVMKKKKYPIDLFKKLDGNIYFKDFNLSLSITKG